MIALIYPTDKGYVVRSLHASLLNAQSVFGRAYCMGDDPAIVVELLTTRHIGDIVPDNEFVALPKISAAITRAISRSTPQGILKGR